MALRFFINGGVDFNWGTTGNWSTSSGGGGGSAVPTTSDDVFLDTNSPVCTINPSSRVCRTINCSAFTNTLTFNSDLTIGNAGVGDMVFGSGMTFSGSSQLINNHGGTHTSNGKPIGVVCRLGATGAPRTHTFSDEWTFVKDLQIGGSSNLTMNGTNQYANAGLTIFQNNLNSGTAKIIMNGTGSLSVNGTALGVLTNDIIFSGTVTQGTGNFFYRSGTLSFSGGTYTPALGSLLILTTGGSGGRFSTEGMKFGNIRLESANYGIVSTLSASSIQVLSSGLILSGNAGFAADTLHLDDTSSTVSIQSGITYDIYSNFYTEKPIGASNLTMNSSTAGQAAFLNLKPGADQNVFFVNATDIDSSGGNTIYSYKGVLNNAANWKNMITGASISSRTFVS